MRKLVFVSFASQIFGFLFYYLTSFVLVRLMPVNDFGVVQQFNLLITTFLPFLGTTFVSSLYYFHPIFEGQERKKIVLQTYVILILIGAIFYIIFTLNKSLFLEILNLKGFSNFPNYIFISIPLYLIASISDNLFLLDKKNNLLLFYLPIEKLLFLASVLTFYYFTGSVKGVFYGIMIYSLIKFIFMTGYIAWEHGLENISFNKERLLRQFRYSFPFYFANIAYNISNKFDKIYINKFVSNEEFALYSIAFLSIPLLSSAVNSINNVAMRDFTVYLKNNDIKSVKRLYRKMVTKSASLALPCVVFFFANSRSIISLLFTDRYVGATNYYRIYLLTFVVSLTSYGLILRATNRTNIIFFINIISSFITVSVGFLLISKFGMTGAIITSVIAVALPGIAQLIIEIRILKQSIIDFFPFKDFLIVSSISVLSIPILFIIQMIQLPVFVILLLSAFFYFLFTTVILNKYNLFPFEDKIKAYIERIPIKNIQRILLNKKQDVIS